MNADNKHKGILVTGGAGFIGSNIVDHLVKEGFANIKVLDNLSTGFISNIQEHIQNKKIEFIKGDITEPADCVAATKDVDVVLHQAALGSIPRSIQDPVTTHDTNVNGFINMLQACRQNKVSRFVYASSSSVYGDDKTMPKKEENTGMPLSPYAVTKRTDELYAKVFAEVYGMEIIGLRYFNVFGPKQNPAGPYAAVIPIFVSKLLKNEAPVIYGDGKNTRDFTFVQNVVEANLLAAFTQNKEALNQVYNIALGATTSLNQLFEIINSKVGSAIKPSYEAPRAGEIKDSQASINKAAGLLHYKPQVSLEQGIDITVKWYKNNPL